MAERRFRVHTWVEGNGKTRRTSTDGTETFRQLWDRSPTAARWAVVSDEQGFAVLDLKDTTFNTSLAVILQKEYRQPTLEAATACAMMLGNPPMTLMSTTRGRRWRWLQRLKRGDVQP